MAHTFLRQTAQQSLCRFNSSSPKYVDVLFEARSHNRLITLNRPRQLNAITHRMILALRENLTVFEKNPTVGLVVIKGAGDRAFCAGGDVTELRNGALSNDALIRSYCYDEYTTHHMTATYRKPYIALIDGLTMGGGVGISCHGRFRVCTEHTKWAMPETAIGRGEMIEALYSTLGLFPDVGAGYILSRLCHRVGMWMGLTSHSMTGIDVKRYGIATHFCEKKMLPQLEHDLLSLKHTDCSIAKVDEILSDYDTRSSHPSHLLDVETESIIERCFSACSVEEIIDRLHADGGKFAMTNAKVLNERSPLALKITHEQLTRAADMPLDDVFTMEHRIVRRIFSDGRSGGDFVEGVRAMLVDKDRKPIWSPATLAEITKERIESYFVPLEYPECDLQLRCPTMS